MLSSKFIGSLSCIWLFMAVYAFAQSTNDSSTVVLDTTGRPLEPGVEYYINPAITDNGGRLTLVNRNGTRCPLFVGQEAVSGPEGLPVIFTPFSANQTVISEERDFKVVFSAATICVQSTQWRVADTDTETGRRLIGTGQDDRPTGYFRISRNNGVYNLRWCPTEVCPTCKFICSIAGILVENGVRLLALDGNVLPVEFVRA